MSYRRTYIERVIRDVLKAGGDADSIFNALDDRRLLVGTGIPDERFKDRPLPEPPFGPQLAKMHSFDPLYQKMADEICRSYVEDGFTFEELASMHHTSATTVRTIIVNAGVKPRKPGGRVKR